MRVPLSVWLIALWLLCIAGACTPAEAPAACVRYVNFKVYDPVYVALDQGFFEAQGICVEVIGDVLAGPTAIQAVASGAADAGLSSLPALINAAAAGLPVLATSDIQSALPGQPLEYYYVRADSDIHSLHDLPGKRFAVNLWKSSFHYTALMALAQAGVPADAVAFVLLGFELQAEALARGEVDVIGLMEPYNAQALAMYGDEFRLLFDAEQVFGQKQFTTHFVNALWAKYNPQQAEAFTAGIAEAITWIEAHPDDARPIIARHTGIEEAYVPDYHFQPHGQVVMEDVAFWLDYLRASEGLAADWLAAEDVATNRYNPRMR